MCRWLVGAAYRASGDVLNAERELRQALREFRSRSMGEFEADILLDLARVRAEVGSREEAQRLAEEALAVTVRSGYSLQEADVRLFLAGLAVEGGEMTTAREQAEAARHCARCDGPPAYTYKVAYDEATRLVRQLGRRASQ